jgi:hypothetical protein
MKSGGDPSREPPGGSFHGGGGGSAGASHARETNPAKRGRGRPRHGEQPKTAYLNVRADEALRARVGDSARAHGLPVALEVERLVRAALDAEEAEEAA